MVACSAGSSLVYHVIALMRAVFACPEKTQTSLNTIRRPPSYVITVECGVRVEIAQLGLPRSVAAIVVAGYLRHSLSPLE